MKEYIRKKEEETKQKIISKLLKIQTIFRYNQKHNISNMERSIYMPMEYSVFCVLCYVYITEVPKRK